VTADTIAEQIRRGAAAHDQCDVRFEGADGTRRATLGELVTDAERAAGALQGLGVRAGDVVGVQLPGTYEGAVMQAAVSLCGAVLLPIVMIYGPRELDFILRQSGAVALAMPEKYRGREHAAPILSRLGAVPSLRFAVVVGDCPPPAGAIRYADLRGRLSRPYQQPDLSPDQRAMLVYTSGTTAEPKGVQHSHRSLLAEVMTPPRGGDEAADSRHLAMFPPGHVAGLLGLVRLLVRGTPMVVLETWDPRRAASLIDSYQITNTAGAPVQLAGLLDQQASGAASLASVRSFLTGAAAVPPSLVERADAAGIIAYRSYGSSEHPTVSSGAVTDPLAKRAYTDGAVLAGNEVRLLDADGRDVPAGEVGEIVTTGPELFLGYTDPALDAAAFLPGRWYRTGDLGFLDADGYLKVIDRLKDIIIRGGENISSKEIEDLLAEHPAIAEAAVVATPDPLMGERVCAVIVPRTGRSFDVAEARRYFAQAGVARQKTPEVVLLVDELPRTPAGKVQKFVLRALAAQEPTGR
jgi:cyclohexanecarboxylate-CoA ligase